MKIAYFELEMWQEKFPKDEYICFKKPLLKSHIKKISDCDILVVFIYSKINSEIINKMPKLKLICTMSTGFDHIDIEYAKSRRIKVCNVPSYGENTVAEHTFSLILALSRKLYPSIKRTHEEKRFETDISLRGFDLKGKTLGLIGGGNIGLNVAKIAKAFDMKILVFDIYKDKNASKKIGFEYVSMNMLLKKSDVISLHVPYNKRTHHMINKENISK